MRSAMFHARPRSWVTTMMPRPSSSRSRSSSARISPRIEASSEETGSSAMSSSRPQGKGARDEHPLLLPAGELVRVAQEQPLGRTQAGLGEGLGDQLGLTATLGVVRDALVQPDALGHRLVDGLPRVQGPGGVLEDHLHPAAEAAQGPVE